VEPEEPNPYTPPESVTAPASQAAVPPPPGANAVAFDTSRPFPRVCLKCAAPPPLTSRHERMSVGAASKASGALGGVFAATLMSTRRVAPDLFWPLLLIGLVVVIGVAAVMQKKAHVVELALPLCEGCNDRWTRGIGLRRWILLVLGVSMATMLLGVAADAMGLVVLGGILFVADIVVAFATGLAKRFIGAVGIDGTVVHLTGVAPEAATAPLPRKRKKKKRSALDAPAELDA
jgi:hypothetical protein